MSRTPGSLRQHIRRIRRGAVSAWPDGVPVWSSTLMRGAILEQQRRAKLRERQHDDLPKTQRDLNNVVCDVVLSGRLARDGARTEADVRRLLRWDR